MSSYDRRAAGRRRAWGRGPVILRFETLEGRQLLSTIGPSPDLIATQFTTVHSATWGSQVSAVGTIANRGTASTSVPVLVDIYASSTPTLNASGAVTQLLGAVVVPAGLAPGASYNFNQLVALPPSTTIATTAATSTIYVTLFVDPNDAAKEANMADKSGRGLNLDTSAMVVTQVMPANLIGTAFSVTPVSTSTPGVISWGDTFDVTEQIKNNGLGAAPPTRARIVLTPAGASQGGYSDVTIGNINVPAIAPFQSTNVVQQVTLPAQEPLTLGNAAQFTISVVQDSDFLTQPIYPRIASQGPGFDQGPIGISPGPEALSPQAATPDLAPSAVVVSQNTLYWGQQFEVGAVIQNVSNVNAGPFTVRFVAAGATGDVSHGIFLGDVQVPNLAANGSTDVLTAVQLPAKLPYGTSVASPAYSQIYAIADPEDVMNESLRSNNMASSAPVLLQVVGTNGTTTTVPTYPQNVYTNPTLALQAAKQVANAQKLKLGTPKPASSTKKHKVSFLASISESVTNGIEKEINAIPKGFNNILKDIGASGNSNASTSAATATTTTSTSTAANNSPLNSSSATQSVAAATSGFSGGTSGGTGGFGASGVSSTTAF